MAVGFVLLREYSNSVVRVLGNFSFLIVNFIPGYTS